MGTQLQPSQLNSPGKDIESYLSSVHSIPILTKEEEQERFNTKSILYSL